MGECFRMTNINRFIEIIEDFKTIRDRTQLQVTPDALFSNARALFISELIAQQKGQTQTRQVQEIQQVKISSPATEKQIKFLRVLGLEIPKGLTKQQAFLLIKEKTSDNET